MTDERDSQNDRQERDSEAGDLQGRDLGAGHPLSPDGNESEQPPPSDIDGGADSRGVSDAGELSDPADWGNESPGVSRRGLVLGGAAGAVAASLGWAAVLGVGGGDTPDGAAGVAVDYVSAIADNDWAAAGALFHEASGFRQATDSYETFLADQGQLDAFTRVTPSVESHHVRFHIPDSEAAAEADAEFSPVGIDPATVDEWKQVRVATSFRTENLDPFENDSGIYTETVTFPFDLSLVLDGDWQIISAGGTIPQFLL